MFVPRRRPEREADQRAAAPVCLAYRRRVNALPEAAPSDSTSRSLQTPAPRSFSLAVCQTLATQSLRARDSGAEPERRFLLCAHQAHLWPWSTSEHSSPIEDACTSLWESHPWVLRRGFSSSRTSRAGASVVSNGPTRDSTPARDRPVTAKTRPTSGDRLRRSSHTHRLPRMYLASPDGVSTSYVKQANVISRARLHAKASAKRPRAQLSPFGGRTTHLIAVGLSPGGRLWRRSRARRSAGGSPRARLRYFLVGSWSVSCFSVSVLAATPWRRRARRPI